MEGATAVTTRPERHFTKRVTRVSCLNPKQKICYSYERIYRVYFTDKTSIDVTADYVTGHTRMRAGGYVVAVGPELTGGFMTADEMNKRYREDI
jgi:hypothetical protein